MVSSMMIRKPEHDNDILMSSFLSLNDHRLCHGCINIVCIVLSYCHNTVPLLYLLYILGEKNVSGKTKVMETLRFRQGVIRGFVDPLEFRINKKILKVKLY